MKKRLFKALPFTLVSLFSLTSCAFVANLLSNVVLTAFMNSNLVITPINLMPEGTNIEPTVETWKTLPTTEVNRREIEYFKNIFIIPKKLSSEILGSPVEINFDLTFSGADNAQDNFKILDITKADLPEDFDLDLDSLPIPLDFGLTVVIPVGDSTLLDSLNSFADISSILENTTQDDLLNATDQIDRDITLTVKGTAAGKEITKNYFINVTKPDLGEIILDQVFARNFLINIYNAQEKAIHSFETLPTDENNPENLSYFFDTLAIPTKVQIKDVGEITFEVTNSSNNFFVGNLTESATIVDAEESLLTGDIEILTFTPLGDYTSKVPEDVTTIEELGNHFEKMDMLTLAPLIEQEESSFSITITATVPGGATRTHEYFFHLKPPVVDDKIIDYIVNNELLLNLINYKDITPGSSYSESIKSITNESKTTEPRKTIEYLVDTLIIPTEVTIAGIESRKLMIDYEINSNSEFKQYTSLQNTKLNGMDVTAATITPLAEFDASEVEENNIEALATAVKAEKSEDLYKALDIASTDIDITLTVKLVDPKNYNKVLKTSDPINLYLSIQKPDLDQELLDYIVEDKMLLNVVNYKDVKADGNYNDAILSIADQATDKNNPFLIDHLVDTVVVPNEVIITEFNRTISVNSHIEFENVGTGTPNFFEATKDANLDGNEVNAKTLTPLGDLNDAGLDGMTIEEFAAYVKDDVTTQDLYKASQAEPFEFSIHTTINLLDDAGQVKLSANKVFYLKSEQPNFDKEIAEEILKKNVINYIDPANVNGSIENPVQPKDSSNPHSVMYFKDTIIIPTEFTFADFDSKIIKFEIMLENEGLFLKSTKNHTYEGENISVMTLTPVGSYDASAVNTFEELTLHIAHYNQAITEYNATADTIETNITVKIYIDGIMQAEQTYYFSLVPFPA